MKNTKAAQVALIMVAAVLVLSAAALAAPPAAPTALSASTISHEQINLAWTDNSNDEEGFQVERKPDGGNWQLVHTTPANATTWDNTGLDEATKYFYRVRAFKGTEYSGYSNEANATTKLVTPTGLSAATQSTTQINLSWTDNSSAEDGYEIQRKPDGGAWATVHTTAANVVSWQNTGLTEATKYFYRVRAKKGTIYSDYSAEASATTKPNAPTGLSATTFSDERIDLAWTDNSDNEDGYKVDRKPDGGAWTEGVHQTGPDGESWQNTGLEEGTKYFYRTKAFKGDQNSDNSNEANATTKLKKPTGVSVTPTDTTKLKVTWTDNSAKEDSYEIERKPVGGGYSLVHTTGADTEEWEDSGLTEATKYFYHLRAKKGTTIFSDWSDEAASYTKPNPPTNICVTNGANATSLVLNWTDVSANNTGYEIERDGSSLTHLANPTASTYTDTGLTTGQEYTYRVRAYVGDGAERVYSNWSNFASGTPVAVTELWPVATATGTPQVGYSCGEYFQGYATLPNYTPSADYHFGVDAMGASGTDVRTPWAGKVSYVGGAGTNRSVEVEVTLGATTHYVSFWHLQNVPAAVVVGANLAKGAKVGEIGANGGYGSYGNHTHVDVQSVTWVWPTDLTKKRNFLGLYTETQFCDPTGNRPEIMDRTSPSNIDTTDNEKIQYKKEGAAYFANKTTPKPGQPAAAFIVDDKVDIVAEAQDQMGHAKPAALYKIAYWVESKASHSHNIQSTGTPYVLHTCATHLIDGATDQAPEIYETGKNFTYNAWTNCGHYVVTNTKGTGGAMADVVTDRHWYTKAKNVAADGEASGFNKGDATGAHNAYFQDGHYKVHIFAHDLIHKMEEEDSVWVENWAPHIIKVEIWQDSDENPATGETPHTGYERQIYSYTYSNPDDGTGLYPAKAGVDYLKTAQKAMVGSGKGGRKIWVRVVFSETMDASWASFALQLDPQGQSVGEAPIVATDIAWSKTDVDNDTVTGVITIPPKKYATMDSKGDLGGSDYSKDAEIVVKARDLADKTLDANSDGTSDTEDRNHKIKVDTKHDVKPDQKPHLKVNAVN